jgi:hypothetical protein
VGDHADTLRAGDVRRRVGRTVIDQNQFGSRQLLADAREQIAQTGGLVFSGEDDG